VYKQDSESDEPVPAIAPAVAENVRSLRLIPDGTVLGEGMIRPATVTGPAVRIAPIPDPAPAPSIETVTEVRQRLAAPERSDRQYSGTKRMAARFASMYRDRFIHTPGQGWMEYNGATWERCDDSRPWNGVEMVCREAYRDVADMSKTDPDKDRLLKAIKDCDSATGTKSVLEHARRWAGIAEVDDNLDADPGLFAVKNGVIELYGDGFRPATPQDRLTMCGAVEYNPEATCPKYDELMSLFHSDPEIPPYLHRLGGAALEGKQNLQVMAIWYGQTAGNGKGTMERAWSRVFGTYAKRIPVEALVSGGKYDQHKDEKAKLRGARLVFTTEPSEGMRFSTGTVKSLTGGDPVTSREVYKGSVTFDPTWLLCMSTNTRLAMGGDPGMARRLKEIPWEYTIPRDQIDDRIEDILAAEAPGILNRLLMGWLSYRADGIQHPASVEQATADYFQEVDPIAQFIEECLTLDDTSAQASKTVVHARYREWCEANGEHFTKSSRALTDALRRKGFREGRVASMRFWHGVTVVQSPASMAREDMWATHGR
jgi:putative DNA primase/helicase